MYIDTKFSSSSSWSNDSQVTMSSHSWLQFQLQVIAHDIWMLWGNGWEPETTADPNVPMLHRDQIFKWHTHDIWMLWGNGWEPTGLQPSGDPNVPNTGIRFSSDMLMIYECCEVMAESPLVCSQQLTQMSLLSSQGSDVQVTYSWYMNVVR